MEGLWTASLAGRGVRCAGAWWARAWRASLSGRALLWVAAGLEAIASSSRLLSLDRLDPRPLRPDDPDLTLAGRLWAGLYLAARGALGCRAAGRLSRRVGRGIGSSVLAGGAWVAMAGAAFVGLGAGGLAAGRGGPFGWAVLLGSGVVVIAVALRIVGRGGAVAARVADADPEEPGVPSDRPAHRTQLVLLSGLLLGTFAVGAAAGGVPESIPVLAVLTAVPVVGAAIVYRPEFLLLVIACFPWVDWGARSVVGGTLGAAWDELLIIGSFGALAVATVLTCRWDLTTVPQAVPMAAVAVAAVGSVVVNPVGPELALFALRVTLQPLLFFLLGYLLPRDRRFLGMTVMVLLAGSVLLAVHGLYQYVTHAPMPASWVDVRETQIGTRAYSIIENPNGLGAYLLLGALVGSALAFGRIGLRWRLAAAGTTVLLVAGIAVTFSRGAWLGLAAGVLALTALAHRGLLAGLVTGAVAALMAAPRPFVDRLTYAFSTEYIRKSLAAGRLYIWQIALERMADHPWFGIGLGTFGGSAAVIFGFSRYWIDNFYVQLATEGGVLLLAAFLWLLLRTFKGTVSAHLRARDPLLRSLAAGGFAAFVAVSAANVTAGVWETLSVGAVSWFVAGLAASVSDRCVAPLPAVRDMTVHPPLPSAQAGSPDERGRDDSVVRTAATGRAAVDGTGT